MEFIEGDDHRLMKAVSRLVDQRRDGYLILPWTRDRHLLRAFGLSLDTMANNSTSIVEYIQATRVHYSTVEGFLTSDPLLLNLRRVAGHIVREHDMNDGRVLCRKNLEACGEILMNGHWEELFNKMEELLHTTDDPDNYCMHIRPIIGCSPDGVRRFNSFLTLYVKKRMKEVMSSSDASGRASTLINIQQRLVKKAEYIHRGTGATVNRVFDQVLRDHPDLRDAVKAQVSVLCQLFD